jgi:hypothetical protein
MEVSASQNPTGTHGMSPHLLRWERATKGDEGGRCAPFSITLIIIAWNIVIQHLTERLHYIAPTTAS